MSKRAKANKFNPGDKVFIPGTEWVEGESNRSGGLKWVPHGPFEIDMVHITICRDCTKVAYVVLAGPPMFPGGMPALVPEEDLFATEEEGIEKLKDWEPPKQKRGKFDPSVVN